jgi:hypothetical protein
MRQLWFLPPVLCIVCCASDKSSATGAVDRDAKFDDISASESAELCAQINALGHNDAVYVEGVCTALGVTLAGPQGGGTCAQQRDACKKEPPALCWLSPGDTDGGQSEDECPDATVGMFLDCMQAGVRTSKELYAGITCDTPAAQVGKLMRDALAMHNANPAPECAAFKRACPAFFEDAASLGAPLRSLAGLR